MKLILVLIFFVSITFTTGQEPYYCHEGWVLHVSYIYLQLTCTIVTIIDVFIFRLYTFHFEFIFSPQMMETNANVFCLLQIMLEWVTQMPDSFVNLMEGNLITKHHCLYTFFLKLIWNDNWKLISKRHFMFYTDT